MTTPELIQFVKSELDRGEVKEAITNKLRAEGWNDFDIIEAFNKVSGEQISPTQVSELPSTNLRFTYRKALLLVGILVLLIGGSAFAYTLGYITPLQKISAQSFNAVREATGVTIDMRVNVDASGITNKDITNSLFDGAETATFSINGSYNGSDVNNPKINLAFTGASGTTETGLNFRVLNQTLYLQLTKAPDLGFFSLKPFENKWVSFPYTGDSTKSNPLTLASGLSPTSLTTLTDEQKEHLYTIANNAHILTVTKKHLPEMINGSLMFRFDFDLDHEGIIEYTKEVVSYLQTITPADSASEKMPTITDEDYNKMFSALKDFHGEAWIGVLDHLPYKLMIYSSIQNPDMPSDGVVSVNARILYSDWNKMIDIEAPKESMNLEDFFAEFMSKGFKLTPSTVNTASNVSEVSPTGTDPLTAARIKATIAEIKSIHTSLRAQAELFYDTNNGTYKGFCSSKGPTGAYVLAKELPQNTVYKCNDSNSYWAAWSQLSTGGYFCADSTGFADSITELPKGINQIVCRKPNFITP